MIDISWIPARGIFALVLLAFTSAAAGAQKPAPRYSLVIHGGAGTMSRTSLTAEMEREYRAALDSALRTGQRILARGGTSLDAVEAVVRSMEDSPLFNAGKGSVFTSAGTNEMDAAIMDGSTLRAGSVAVLRHVRNPIGLARLVMEKSPHVMMVGDGAEDFAREQNVELVAPHYFWTERRWNAYLRRRDSLRNAGKGADADLSSGDGKFGTVGAVALDMHGNLAAATSTGGTLFKRYGRLGDVPIIGAGTYANNASCAVSATGTGEFFIRNTVASDICARVRYAGMTIQAAADEVVMKVLVAQKGEGGVIAMDRQGNIATPFNTSGMYRGWIGRDGSPVVKIYRD